MLEASEEHQHHHRCELPLPALSLRLLTRSSQTILVHGRLRRPSSRSLSLLPAHRLETTLAEDEIANGSIDIENLPPADERPSEVSCLPASSLASLLTRLTGRHCSLCLP